MDGLIKQTISTHMRAWIKEAGKMIREQMNETQIINKKSNANDLVTEMDRMIERFFTHQIRSNYPEHSIISEEGYGDNKVDEKGYVWFVDPIDGTLNYIHQQRNFAISVAVYQDGIGEIGMIYDVAADVLYSAQKNLGAFRNDEKLAQLNSDQQLSTAVISLNHYWLLEGNQYKTSEITRLIKHVRACRTFGSAALELAYIAEGSIDVYLKKRLEPWDVAAGMIIINEVGGKLTNLLGEQIDIFKTNSVLASNTSLHDEVIDNYLLKAKK